MRKLILTLAVAALAPMFLTGCAEQKLGRGISNTWEIVRWGELRRSIEQEAVFPTPGNGAYGVVKGIDRSLCRTGLGVYEIVTFPFPPYHPIWTNYLTPDPAFPASYEPGLMSDALLYTDTYTGFSGGDVMPLVPGSRFTVF